MSKKTVEEIKDESRSLRGPLAETLSSEASHFTEEEYQLLKFHGTYQQDNRDTRSSLTKEGRDKEWIFMVRSKIPGGAMTADQYLVHDTVAEDLANGTLRLTTRQGIQFHGIVKGTMKEVIQRINDCGLTTWGACGDVVRNTMATPLPYATPVFRDVIQLSRELSKTFLPHSTAYSEIWLDGEKLETGREDAPEPIYGRHYLPRKFKIGIAVPPVNDIDVYTQDIGIIPHFPNGTVEGYTYVVGGGFGMSHGQTATYPVLAKPLAYITRDQAVDAAIAIITTQRDHGRRDDRKQSRLKYLIEQRGLDWFRNEVQARLPFPLQPAKEVKFTTVSDVYGWTAQGDGKWFRTIYVPQGRIQDTAEVKQRTAFREITRTLKPGIRLTPNCNLMFHDVAEADKAKIDTLLAAHGVPSDTGMTEAHRMSHACVSLPTCGLGLAESERALGPLMDQIDPVLRELGLEKEQILFRMTGCPNGCARPYNADFAFVGRAPGKYALFVGGSVRGDRLAGLEEKMVKIEELPQKIRAILTDYKHGRKPGETFTDWWGRARPAGAAPHPDQFHVEFAARKPGSCSPAG